MCIVLEKRLSGSYGEFWRKVSSRQVAIAEEKASNGEIVVDANGAAKWAISGNYLPDEYVELLQHTSFADKFDPDTTVLARRVQTAEELKRNRECAVVVDVITGQRFKV